MPIIEGIIAGTNDATNQIKNKGIESASNINLLAQLRNEME